MSEVTKVLCTRRSIRSFKEDMVPDDVLNEILNCGLYAPSGHGKQSAKIVVIKNKDTINEIGSINASFFGKDIDPFYGAPVLLVVFADKEVPTYQEDGAAVITNILNAAFSLGVDSCWIHRAKETFNTDYGEYLKERWGLSDNYVGIGNVILGYRNGDLPKPAPRKENRIIFD